MYMERINININMVNQKTDTIDRDKTDSATSTITSNNSSRRSSEPPSWSELSNKMMRQFDITSFGSKTISYISAIFILGFGTSLLFSLSIPGGWLMTVFLISIMGGLVSDGDYIESSIAGATVLGITTLISGFLLAFITAGFTVVLSMILGAIAGIFGTAIGDMVTN